MSQNLILSGKLGVFYHKNTICHTALDYTFYQKSFCNYSILLKCLNQIAFQMIFRLPRIKEIPLVLFLRNILLHIELIVEIQSMNLSIHSVLFYGVKYLVLKLMHNLSKWNSFSPEYPFEFFTLQLNVYRKSLSFQPKLASAHSLWATGLLQ